MLRALFVSACLSVVVLAGCGSSNPARADCENMIENHFCPAVVNCGAPYSSVASCDDFFENPGSPLDCSTVTTEAPGYAACIDAIEGGSCGYLVDGADYAELPAACAIFN
jgi:hypothetical protein